MTRDVDWLVVQGSGAHIRSAPGRLVVSQGSGITEHRLADLRHLLLQGRHTIQTATVNRLVREGVRITFLDPDGGPVAVTRPFGDHDDERLRRLQQELPAHSVATTIVAHAAHVRLGLLGEARAEFYAGEIDLLQGLLAELPNLVRLEELRRAHRMTGDMYYEIAARTLPPALGFRRRTEPPHRDPVNAILSFSYGLLSSAVLSACLGARLDPALGPLSGGAQGLVHDLADCFRTEMVDRPVFGRIREGVAQDEFDLTAHQCRLADGLTREVATLLRSTIAPDRIDRQVQRYVQTLEHEREFVIL